jgi:uroporphyrinogen-III decarboxylase
VRYWLEYTKWRLDAGALAAGLANVGNDGTIIFQLLPSPLKQFHWLAGQVNASYFITDHPQEMQELAEIYAERSLAYVEAVAGLPDIWVYEVADNLDSLFYPPRWFKQFCVPVLQQAARILHGRGKYLFVHACGKLKKLAPQYLEAELDCVEGQAPPPIGDWPLHEARALSEKLIVCGGMAAPEQELAGLGAAGAIDTYVKELFASMGDKRRFVFASSCNTSPRTPYANLVAFRDSAWRYGEVG